MHRDPKKSHRDNYIPPENVPDLAYEDNRPIKGMKDDDFNNVRSSTEKIQPTTPKKK